MRIVPGGMGVLKSCVIMMALGESRPPPAFSQSLNCYNRPIRHCVEFKASLYPQSVSRRDQQCAAAPVDYVAKAFVIPSAIGAGFEQESQSAAAVTAPLSSSFAAMPATAARCSRQTCPSPYWIGFQHANY
jgi:hypothetical protein